MGATTRAPVGANNNNKSKNKNHFTGIFSVWIWFFCHITNVINGPNVLQIGVRHEPYFWRFPNGEAFSPRKNKRWISISLISYLLALSFNRWWRGQRQYCLPCRQPSILPQWWKNFDYPRQTSPEQKTKESFLEEKKSVGGGGVCLIKAEFSRLRWFDQRNHSVERTGNSSIPNMIYPLWYIDSKETLVSDNLCNKSLYPKGSHPSKNTGILWKIFTNGGGDHRFMKVFHKIPVFFERWLP